MREIERQIVSAIIFSAEGKILLGRKHPEKGGVFIDCWHIPGGGVDQGETFAAAIRREVLEEVGLDISSGCRIVYVNEVNDGVSEKTLPSGEKVMCKMEFNYFEIYLEKNSGEVELKPEGDLVEVKWFSQEELKGVKQIPGGKEFFEKMGYIK